VQTRQASGSCPVSSIPEGWQLTSKEKDYMPTEEDVGCRLRVQVTAEAEADGEVLAGPVAIFTEVVLQAPGAPPKRVSHCLCHWLYNVLSVILCCFIIFSSGVCLYLYSPYSLFCVFVH
jgi:hypothetical protein